MLRTSLVPLLLFALSSLIAQTTERQYLSGTDKDHRVDWDFHIDRGRNSGEWGKIAVPGNWEFEGYGIFSYGQANGEDRPGWRQQLPESDATATYRHTFTAPADWAEKHVDLVFEGVMTDARVMVNGRSAGPVHQGGFYEFSYPITDLLRPGENELEVVVNNVSRNESVNQAERDADFWVHGGIYRPVYLEVKPRQHIERIATDARADGALTIHVFTAGQQEGVRARAQVQALSGQVVGTLPVQTIGREDSLTILTGTIDDVDPWSPEFPHLYDVVVLLEDTAGKPIHEFKERTGFRTFELRPQDGFYLNGTKVMFRGVNRHTSWPTSGRTTSKELSIQDVNLMKDMNMNAVRMSHYPPEKHFLEVCDSLGLLVIDELTGWQDAYDTIVGRKLVKELVVRDVNHPSVVLWANGNEGGNNYALLGDYRIYDPQDRTVIHPWGLINDTYTFHYADFNCCGGSFFNGTEVFFPTEFLHGLYDGGHGAGLADWWREMRGNPLAAGGFLWVFADEGVVRSDTLDTQGNKAPDGIVGPYREKEGSFYAIREIWSPIAIDRKRLPPRFDGRLKLENRFHFTDLDQCTLEMALVELPGPGESRGADTALQTTVDLPSVAPGLNTYVDLGLPEDWESHDALELRAFDPHGRLVMHWSLPIATPQRIASNFVDNLAPAPRRPSLEKTETTFILSAAGVEVVLNKTDGTIRSVRNGKGAISLSNGPRLTTGEATVEEVIQRQEGDTQMIQFVLSGPLDTLAYRMLPSGVLQLDYAYFPRGNHDYMGITFDYPEERVKGVRYLGDGPYRVWKNRLQGVNFGLHEKAYNNTVTGESWDYPEFKGYYSNLYWATLETEEQHFTILTATPGNYLHLFTPDPPRGATNDNTDGRFPEGNLSIMEAISPIGSKFKVAEKGSPSGATNQFRGHRGGPSIWGGRLWFDFRGEK
jgi:hypothetical protein